MIKLKAHSDHSTAYANRIISRGSTGQRIIQRPSRTCVEKNKLYAPISHHFGERFDCTCPVGARSLELGCLGPPSMSRSANASGTPFSGSESIKVRTTLDTTTQYSGLRLHTPYIRLICPQFLVQVLETSILPTRSDISGLYRAPCAHPARLSAQY